MSIGFQCPGCQRPYSVDSALAGKRVRCKQCGNEMRVPTPSRPVAAAASASPAKSKPKAPPVPADIYGFDDEPAEPMPSAPAAPIPRATAKERPSRSSGVGSLSDLFGWGPKKRQSSGEGPWGVPLRYVVIVLFFLSVGGSRMARREAVQPQVLALINYVRLGGTALMAVTVVGALASFLLGNRGAFRGNNRNGQIGWGWAVAWFSALQVMVWMGPNSGRRPATAEPIPPAKTVQADQPAVDGSTRDPIPQTAASEAPEVPRAVLEQVAPVPTPGTGPAFPPPTGPPLIQPPDFPLPGPPPGLGRPPGFPPAPPRPSFPGPPGR